MSPMPGTQIHLADERTSLIDSAGSEVTIGVGLVTIGRGFRHDGPTPPEMERAIDMVEDAIMATRLPGADRGPLWTKNPVLSRLPGLTPDSAVLTRDEVETLFQRLASASLGSPAALGDLQEDRMEAAALLLLRECMHHLGYTSIRAAATKPASGETDFH